MFFFVCDPNVRKNITTLRLNGRCAEFFLGELISNLASLTLYVKPTIIRYGMSESIIATSCS